MHSVIGVRANGERVYYTGKAGQAFVSANENDGFQYVSLEGARNRATILNRGFGLHDIWFHSPEDDSSVPMSEDEWNFAQRSGYADLQRGVDR